MGTLSIIYKIWATMMKGFLVFDLRKQWSWLDELWQDEYIDAGTTTDRKYSSYNRCITRYPEVGLDKQGNSRLNLACKEGSFAEIKQIVDGDLERKLCCAKDKDGNTPMHIAAKKGKVEVLQLLLDAYPASIEEVNAAIETCLHTAVVYNKGKTIQFLLTWLARNSDYAHLINSKDYDGYTALHLATSRKQLQSLKVFLTCDPSVSKWVQVNAMNCNGLTALDVLFVLPHSGQIDMEMEKILRRAGGLRTQSNPDCNNYLETRKSHVRRISSTVSAKDVLLLMSTLVATLTFQAAISFPSIMYSRSSGSSIGNNIYSNSITTRSFVLFNSTGFIAAVSTILFLLHQLPMKPWPQISVSTLFASYMCVISVISPRQALPLLSLSVPFLLLAAAGKLFVFHDSRVNVM